VTYLTKRTITMAAVSMNIYPALYASNYSGYVNSLPDNSKETKKRQLRETKKAVLGPKQARWR
jgi:hypothetical protein